MSLQVALLRGVNVGGRKLVMSELRARMESAGFTDVRTLLASGNLVLRTDLKAHWLEKKLEQIIAAGFALKTDVFVRTGKQVEEVVAANRFKDYAKNAPNCLVVHFMRAPPTEDEIHDMETSCADETIHHGKNCLYITYPMGQGVSRLKLPKLGTARNWNTVLKLAAATQGE
ncbi:MAG: DUF1697 domain-containing protein [Terricaulis sp.]